MQRRSAWVRDLDVRLKLLRALQPDGPFTPVKPMAEAAVARFEKKHRVVLPAAYRGVLRFLGTGVGYDSGLLPLAAFAPTAMPRVTVTITSVTGETTSAGSGSRPTLGRAAEMKRPFDVEGEHPFDGCVELVDQGCGYRLLLAITGPRAGEVWSDTTAADDGAFQRVGTFEEWMDGWVEEALVWCALAVATADKPSARAKQALIKAGPIAEAVMAKSGSDRRLVYPLAQVRLALGNRRGALALLPKLLAWEQGRLRSAVYAVEIAAASAARPALKHAKHAAREVRLALAANPAVPAKVVVQLASDDDSEVRSRAARHPNAPPELLERVARGCMEAPLGVEAAKLVELALRNAAASPELVEDVVRACPFPTLAGAGVRAGPADDRTYAVVLRGAALADACPPQLRARLATSCWPEVRHGVAACRATTEATIRVLALDPDRQVRVAIAWRRDAPSDVLDALTHDANAWVRSVAAWNPRTPARALARLASTGTSIFYLARNAGLPSALVAALAHLAGYEKEPFRPPPEDVPMVRDWVDELDTHKLPATAPAADVANVRHWSYPVAALRDYVEPKMGSYDLASRQWLPADHAAELASDAYAYTRAYIAGRADLEPRVLARLAADESEITRRAAAENPTLPLALLRRLAADPVDTVREHAAMNPALPADDRARLLTDSAPYVRRGVARSPNATPAELAQLARDPSDDVRRWVAYAAATPVDVLDGLAKDPDEQTRGRVAFRRAAEAYLAG